jgi:WD40 repeat protein
MFAPSDTMLRKKYFHELPPIGIQNGCERMWDSCLRTMEGHSGGIRSVACSPDGTRIVSGSYDKTLQLWDAVSGAHLNTLKGHSSYICSVAFSPDGTRIVSGSDDKTLRLWDAVSGAHLNTLKGHSKLIRSVAFSPDGTYIVSGSNDNTHRLWDAVRGAHINTLEGYSDPAASAVFSDYIGTISRSSSGDIKQWNAVGGTLISVDYACAGFYIASYRSQRQYALLLFRGWVDLPFNPSTTHVLDSREIPRCLGFEWKSHCSRHTRWAGNYP